MAPYTSRPASARLVRQRQVICCSSGGGSSGIGGGPSGGGGGGSGGDSGASPGDDDGSSKKKSGLLQGWDERAAYDPEFPVKVLMEQVIGVGACIVGDMSARPNWGLNELDLIFSTLIVGSIMNFSIMFLLAPTAATAGAASAPFLTRLFGDYFLKTWGAPGGNMFEPGSYGVVKRLINLGYKGLVFAMMGFAAGAFGTSLSNGLLALRKRLDPTFQLQNEPPNIFWNAFTWSVHMGISSNLRYQCLGGLDTMLINVMPISAFRVYQAVVRGSNNIVGGMSFVTLARILGTQKASAPAAPATATS